MCKTQRTKVVILSDSDYPISGSTPAPIPKIGLPTDGRTGLEFSYNILNLPSEVHDSPHNMQMRYTYLSDGTKVSALDAAGKGLLYKGNFVYDKTGNTVNLKSVAWDEGRIRKTVLPVSEDIGLIDIGGTIAEDGTFPGVLHPGKTLATDSFIQVEDSELTVETADEVIYRPAVHITQDQWFVKDHLGNVRSVLNLSASRNASVDDVILEQNDYLPFGTRMSLKEQAANRYRYAGKEEQNIAGMDLSLLDFGARYYDAFVGRWNAIDPMAHKYFGMSPYNYCGNDPVNRFDPDGRETIKSLWIKEPNSYDPKYKKPASDKCDTKKDSGTDRYNKDRDFVRENRVSMNKNMPDYDNILTFVAHGVVDENKKSVDKIIVSKDGGRGEQMKVDAVAEYLSENSSVVKNAKEKGTFAVIFLMSCATAQNGKDSIASQLSINMGSVVIAPTETCLSNGNVENNGKWKVYYKGYLLDTVSGDGNSIYEYLSNFNSNMH